jgi:hypothetical protein
LYKAITSPCDKVPRFTRKAPSYINKTMAALIIIYVNGFIKLEILPTLFCDFSNLFVANWYFSISSCSLVNALITLTPVRFSRVLFNTPSTFS